MNGFPVIAAVAILLSVPATALAQDCESCTAAREKNGWCADCKVGYVDGEKTKCRSCFDIRTSGKSGWCDGCKVGYSSGLKTSCKNCFDLMKAKEGGWCDGCKVGYAAGIKTSCKSCLAAIRADGWCANCKVGYVAAQKTKCKSCYDLMKSKDGGWCADCAVGHARGLKTQCKKCFEAIKTNGSCADCSRSFKDGVAYRIVRLHVHDLDQEEVRGVLEKIDGVANVRFPKGEGRVDLDLKEGSKTAVKDVLAALDKAGVHAHEGDK